MSIANWMPIKESRIAPIAANAATKRTPILCVPECVREQASQQVEAGSSRIATCWWCCGSKHSMLPLTYTIASQHAPNPEHVSLQQPPIAIVEVAAVCCCCWWWRTVYTCQLSMQERSLEIWRLFEISLILEFMQQSSNTPKVRHDASSTN